MKFLITQFSTASGYFLPLKTKYSLQHPVLKDYQSVFFFYGEKLSFKST